MTVPLQSPSECLGTASVNQHTTCVSSWKILKCNFTKFQIQFEINRLLVQQFGICSFGKVLEATKLKSISFARTNVFEEIVPLAICVNPESIALHTHTHAHTHAHTKSRISQILGLWRCLSSNVVKGSPPTHTHARTDTHAHTHAHPTHTHTQHTHTTHTHTHTHTHTLHDTAASDGSVRLRYAAASVSTAPARLLLNSGFLTLGYNSPRHQLVPGKVSAVFCGRIHSEHGEGSAYVDLIQQLREGSFC